MRDRVELQRFPIALAVRSGNGYLNPSLSSFAVLPEVGLASGNNLEDLTEDGYDTYSVPNKMAAEIVLEFQRICTDGGKRQDKLDFLKPIFHLWSEGQVLFPLGFMWGQSALGALDPNLCVWLGDQTGELQEQTRSAIQAFPVIQGLSPKRGTNSASAIYKLALAFQLSSTHIRSLFDIRSCGQT